MGYADLIEKLQALPLDKQAEVFDFVEFLALRCQQAGSARPTAPVDWTGPGFSEFSLSQAMRGLEDDPVIYSKDDLQEQWQ